MREVALLFLTVWAGLIAQTSYSSETFDVFVKVDDSTTEKEHPEGRLFDGPCGPKILRSVADLNDLVPEERNTLDRVLEYDDSGEIVSKWRIPLDAIPQGISGEWLIVGRPGHHMAISRAGELRSSDIPDHWPRPEYEGYCSKKVRKAFLGEKLESAYLRCWTLKDLATGSRRFVAFEGPCT